MPEGLRRYRFRADDKGLGVQGLSSRPGHDRTSTTWAANYYHYHEDWTFVSVDSVAIRTGQWGWSMPVDPKLISADSLYLGDPEVVAYRLEGDHLTLDVHGDGGMDTLTWDGERFVSNWMYTYGHVVLIQGGNADCRMHD